MKDSKMGKKMAADPQQKVRIPEATIASAAENNPNIRVQTTENQDSKEKPSKADKRQSS